MKLCMVIDDSGVICKVARCILNSLGYDVVEVASGKEAVDACRKQMPDAILLDFDLPDMSGFDFLVELGNRFQTKPDLIVYATTENDPVDISRAINAGASHYIIKPFDRAALEAKFPTVAAVA